MGCVVINSVMPFEWREASSVLGTSAGISLALNIHQCHFT